MKKMILMIILCLGLTGAQSVAQEHFKKRFAFEISLGPRIPLGITKDDITTGLAFNAGLGYKVTRFFELFHLGIDFGNSSPHNPNMVVVRRFYGDYGTLAMETVSIYGLPLTTRLHFHLKKNIDGFIGGGGAYYWFSSRLEAPGYYGGAIELREPRKRNGYGTILEAGLFTDFFSERWLIMMKGNVSFLKTNGRSLSIKDEDDLESKSKRNDRYLTISIGVRYLL